MGAGEDMVEGSGWHVANTLAIHGPMPDVGLRASRYYLDITKITGKRQNTCKGLISVN